MSCAIKVKHLGKAYKQYPNKWARLLEWIIPFSKSRHHLHWVLKDISLELSPGQTLGIIGVNGAGKSTLLKMLAGTSQVSTGLIEVTGKIAALLELGMGFHPEFTGRQNVLMSGQLLGYSSDQIDRLMPEIEEFAGIGQYIDHPVRIYSSGMQVRLAFSIATAIRPDVLVVDEALSVGDAEFQHRSFERIREFRKLGTSILFVSHDKGVVISLCDRAILLNQGQIALEGEPEMVMDYYNAMLAQQSGGRIVQTLGEDGKVQTQSGTGEVCLLQTTLLSANGHPVEVVQVGQAVQLRISTQCQIPIESLVVGFMIKDRLGQAMYGTNTFHLQQQLYDLAKNASHTFLFDFNANLGSGDYSISIALHGDATHLSKNYLWLDRHYFSPSLMAKSHPLLASIIYQPMYGLSVMRERIRQILVRTQFLIDQIPHQIIHYTLGNQAIRFFLLRALAPFPNLKSFLHRQAAKVQQNFFKKRILYQRKIHPTMLTKNAHLVPKIGPETFQNHQAQVPSIEVILERIQKEF